VDAEIIDVEDDLALEIGRAVEDVHGVTWSNTDVHRRQFPGPVYRRGSQLCDEPVPFW